MKILVVDDHALFREGICHVLKNIEEIVTVLEAANYEQATQFVLSHSDLDLILLDLNLPGKDGFETLEEFSIKFPALPIVILSASNSREDVKRALDMGAVGFVHKDTSSQILLSALRIILAGGVYVPANMADDEVKTQYEGAIKHLTPRQLEVLELLRDGLSNKVIASDMGLAEATVKMHVTAIFKALDVTNRTQAALAAEKLTL